MGKYEGICCTSDVGWATPYIGILGTRLKLTAFISFTVLRTSRARHSSATWADEHVSRNTQRIQSADDCVIVWDDDERSEKCGELLSALQKPCLYVWTLRMQLHLAWCGFGFTSQPNDQNWDDDDDGSNLLVSSPGRELLWWPARPAPTAPTGPCRPAACTAPRGSTSTGWSWTWRQEDTAKKATYRFTTQAYCISMKTCIFKGEKNVTCSCRYALNTIK